jgi:hypothetical protein
LLPQALNPAKPNAMPATITIWKGSLWLGGEVSTYPSLFAGGIDGYDSVKMAYTIDGGSNQNLNLAFLNNPVPNNDKWQTLATAGVAVCSMLSVGAHTINVRFNASDLDGNSLPASLNNSGNGWTTNFNVVAAPVPEPASGALILAGLGMIGVMAKRRRVVG